ncbi:UDP-N-acetylglucosamine transferase subunit ALG14 homolog isoform X2 [Anolis carolinensis]|uniref:UDP-N-acetylglucosamine transferase subunit ALG14 homolog isoform X2 n=1 Tax=Anolis carolinensis TaxID=28377 RepID=UPI000462925C|nr:PREDICTED: UDP-N-acetylglucosamine transferase subunit ALG14 homolog isoform X2 [Anolis carolinensis]|eukprot:XP_008107394.1 PREDICTED: UDP-N-acetylglucosamine transferase subunit ALG14 homolog isoform X2 [Anolis carolinensis]
MKSFHTMLATVAAAALLFLLLLLFIVRFFPRKETQVARKSTVKLLAVAGSGGHTTEILRLLGSLSQAYCPRHYILADSDKMSEDKIRSFEQKRAEMFSDSLVLCNGPGTCVPICVSALLLKMLGLKKVTIVYIESICRVENLSLSGKILYYFSDYFFVQWPTLKEKYPKALYLGRIV